MMSFLSMLGLALHALVSAPATGGPLACELAPAIPVQDETPSEVEVLRQKQIQEDLELMDAFMQIDGRSDNAATYYRELFRELTRRRDLYQELMEDVYAREDEHLTDQELYETPEMVAYLEEARRYRALLRKAVEAERVDFGLQRDAGFNMLLPHLSPMRKLARYLRRTSRQLRISGNMAESAEDLILILGMARHAGPDRIIISSLVGTAIASVAMNEIELALTERQIDPISAERLLQGLRPLGEGDPFHYSDAVDGEYEMLEITFSEENLSQDDVMESLVEMIELEAPTNEDGREWVEQFPVVDGPWVRNELRRAKPLFKRLSDLILLEDRLAARRETRAIMIAVEEGEYGILNAVIMPGIGRTINTKHFNEELIEYLITSLKAIRTGADPSRFGNAALIYERVIELLPRRIRPRDQTALNILRQLVEATGSCDQIEAELLESARRVLEREQGLLEMIHRAARVERCVWRRARQRALAEEAIPEGDWVRPMRAMVRLMLAEAAVAFCNPDPEAARNRVESSLKAALGLCLQLADGSHLFGQLAATAALEEFERFLGPACEKGLVSGDAAESMRRRVQTAARVNLDRWRLAGDSMIGEGLFDLIQKFGTTNRADAMILGKRWSRDRLFMTAFFRLVGNSESEATAETLQDGYFQARFNFVNEMNSSGDRGELYLVDDIFKVDSAQRESLQQPVSKLLELLNRIDAVDSPKIAQWQLRCAACLSRLDTTLENCRQREMEPALD